MGAIAVGGWVADAAPGAGKGVISACYAARGTHKGQLRVLSSGDRCRAGERRLSWNKQGIAGSAGPRGAQGPSGAPGAAGPTGPADPSEAFNQGLFPGSPGLTLPAGSYYVKADLQITNPGSAALEVTCTLTIGAPSAAPGAKDIKTVTVAPGAKAVVPLQQIHELSATGPANASCDSGGWTGLLVALRVGTVHEM